MMIKRQDKAISNSKRPKQDLEAQALERGRLEKSNASQVANVMPTYYDPRHAPVSLVYRLDIRSTNAFACAFLLV